VNAKDRDRVMAKFRMRKLRARSGGLTTFDRARNEATIRLIRAHRAEFDQLRKEHIRREIEGS
jgi:hypothetical protein